MDIEQQAEKYTKLTSGNQITPNCFFPAPDKLTAPSLSQLRQLKFKGKRLDLEVYHLAYATKKLRACTYRRMARRQQLKNQRKKNIAMSPEQISLKAQKVKWLNDIQEKVGKQQPSVKTRLVRKIVNQKKEKKSKKKFTKKIRKGNQAAKMIAQCKHK